MNEIFSFRKELNIKKIVIVALIIFMFIVAILWKMRSPKENPSLSQIQKKATETTFYSTNKNLSLKLSSSYGFVPVTSTSNYILELKNKNNLNIFIAEENLLSNLPLSELANADLKYYIAKFENSSNISNVSEFNRGGKPAYTYSFHYLDPNTKTAYYLQTIWLEYNDKYYIIDIEFPLNSLSENSNIINDILNSIVIN